mmetsp:Transcript_21517/g.45501  ORF Transcript_21517/g.45501 Transcript_21517/m.45501 type:complete len:227 (+) Transcript_21517:1667-2347(+)
MGLLECLAFLPSGFYPLHSFDSSRGWGGGASAAALSCWGSWGVGIEGRVDRWMDDGWLGKGRIGWLVACGFLYGIDAIPPPNFPDDRQNAAKADRLARSAKVPRALLPRANDLWRKDNPDFHYGDSYKTMNPQTFFEHEAGLVISTAFSSHLLRAHNKNRKLKPIRCGIDKECKCTADNHPLLDKEINCPPITQLSPDSSLIAQAATVSGSENTFVPTDSDAFTSR